MPQQRETTAQDIFDTRFRAIQDALWILSDARPSPIEVLDEMGRLEGGIPEKIGRYEIDPDMMDEIDDDILEASSTAVDAERSGAHRREGSGSTTSSAGVITSESNGSFIGATHLKTDNVTAKMPHQQCVTTPRDIFETRWRAIQDALSLFSDDCPSVVDVSDEMEKLEAEFADGVGRTEINMYIMHKCSRWRQINDAADLLEVSSTAVGNECNAHRRANSGNTTSSASSESTVNIPGWDGQQPTVRLVKPADRSAPPTPMIRSWSR
ncbi:hypothetical protein EVJ58_g1389 [Rhodofomes roseus]|uniref:Uncharacterized protein n=1 Tax=Rhodofomes roseus TaxID=34475 RepID=A0A4Y9Z1B8_9APHY|nr:hypothetical protein EVJ58_g1389 [Rhodofomes roseus]